jgi:hypothetical protein
VTAIKPKGDFLRLDSPAFTEPEASSTELESSSPEPELSSEGLLPDPSDISIFVLLG